MNGNRHFIKSSFWRSFLYVGLATISVLSLPHDSPLHGSWMFIGIVITLPVSFISFGIMYMEPSGYYLVLLVQFIHFLLLWAILFFFYKAKGVKKPPLRS